MEELTHNQEPEILKYKAEILQKAADQSIHRETGLLGKLFPDEITKIRQTYIAELAKEQQQYEVGMVREFRTAQLKIFKRFMEDNIKRMVLQGGGDITDLQDNIINTAVAKLANSQDNITNLLTDKLGNVADTKSKNQQLGDRAEQSMFTLMNNYYDVMDEIMIELRGRIETILEHKKKA